MVVIAIDGPAGAGKSTVAKKVAQALSFQYIDSGALYRAVAYKMIKEGYEPHSQQLIDAIRSCSILLKNGRTYLDDEDVTEKIRGEDVECVISEIASDPRIREILSEWQRKYARGKNLVIEGRDIGTVVFTDALLKFYIDASPKVRAKRRYLELYEKGKNKTFEDVLASIIARDEADMSREIAPLKKAPDAIYIDTSSMGVDEVVARIIKCVKKKMRERSFLYRVAQAFLWALCRLLFRIEVEGLHYIPRSGPLLICANHFSYLDPIVLGVCIPRKVSFMAKSELFSVPLLGNIIKKFDSFPIKREGFSRSGIMLALRRMEQGKALIIFPEGTRSKDAKIHEAKRGAGYIASFAQKEYGAVVIPARIRGTERILPPSKKIPLPYKLKISFGPPIHCAEKKPEDAASLIMEAICGL